MTELLSKFLSNIFMIVVGIILGYMLGLGYLQFIKNWIGATATTTATDADILTEVNRLTQSAM